VGCVPRNLNHLWLPCSSITTIQLPFCRCHFAVAITKIPQEFRKCRKNYVAYVKNSVVLLTFQLPLRRNRRSVANRIESYFCRSSIVGQPISVLVIVQMPSMERRFQQFRSHAQWQRYLRNGTTATVQWNGRTEWQNGNGSTAME